MSEEAEKAMNDAALYGAGVMKDGKRIDLHDMQAKEIADMAEKLAAADPPESLPDWPVNMQAVMRHPTFIHEQGDPARWDRVIELAYRDRRRVLTMARAEPTAVMISRDERRNCIAWLRQSGQHSAAYQHGGGYRETDGDDRLFGLPVFWAAPGSMKGMTVIVLTDFSKPL